MQRALFSATTVVSVVGLAAEVLRHGAGVDAAIVPFLSLSEESNLPTWYASMLLSCCALAIAAVAGAVADAGRPFVRHWAVLAAGFLLMSLDEIAQLHERLHSGWFGSMQGVLYFDWIVPASVVVLFVGAAYVRFLAHLPPPTRRRFLLAGCLYVGGAVGMEVPLGLWAARHGELDLGYAALDALEESMELFGATLFLLAVLRHLELLRAERTKGART